MRHLRLAASRPYSFPLGCRGNTVMSDIRRCEFLLCPSVCPSVSSLGPTWWKGGLSSDAAMTLSYMPKLAHYTKDPPTPEPGPLHTLTPVKAKQAAVATQVTTVVNTPALFQLAHSLPKDTIPELNSGQPHPCQILPNPQRHRDVFQTSHTGAEGQINNPEGRCSPPGGRQADSSKFKFISSTK